MRVAIAHDYLTQRGGAERVVLTLARAFPEAPIYTTLYEPGATYPEFADLDVRTSWLNRVGVLRRHHRLALPLLPAASSSISIDADIVIASSSGWAHGFRTTGRKLVYCYSPARWLYEPDRYLGDDSGAVKRATLRVMSPALRRWDRRAAESADRYLAISTVTQGRIRHRYALDADVVPAPHNVSATLAIGSGRLPGVSGPGYFLVVSRLLPYKNVLPIVQAFATRSDLRLVVVGAGPQKPQLRAAAGANTTFLEDLTDEQMQLAYQGCRALVAASHEDFGLTPLEAAAHGKPAVVLRWGGFLDTVVEGETGVFFDSPTPEDILRAVQQAGTTPWDAPTIVERAGRFSEQRFTATIRDEITSVLA